VLPTKKPEVIPAAVLGGDDVACDDFTKFKTTADGVTATQQLDKEQLPAQNDQASLNVSNKQLSEYRLNDSAAPIPSLMPSISPGKQILQSVVEKTLVQEAAAPVTLENLTPALWYQVYCGLDVKGVLKTIIANCEMQQIQGNKILLVLDQQHATLFNESHVVRLTKALDEYFGQSLELSIQLGEVQTETPAARVIRQKQQRQLQAVENFKSNNHVQNMLEVFSAALIDETIRPLES
jgi:DNA polymerase-3 subunit gamma/tau